VWCSLWGTVRILKYYLEDLWFQRVKKNECLGSDAETISAATLSTEDHKMSTLRTVKSA
jgi:hypothetical protein